MKLSSALILVCSGWDEAPEHPNTWEHGLLEIIMAWCLLHPGPFIAPDFLIYFMRASSKSAHGNTCGSQRQRMSSLWHYDTFIDRTSSRTLTFDSIYLSFVLHNVWKHNKISLPNPGKLYAFPLERTDFIHLLSTPYWLHFNKKMPHMISNFWYPFISQSH